VPGLSAHLTQRLIEVLEATVTLRRAVDDRFTQVSVARRQRMAPRPCRRGRPGTAGRHVWGKPDEDRWLTVQVAALRAYQFDLSEPDVLDQADEISALIPAILAQPHQDGDTALALETGDWLAPLDSVALVGATVNLSDRTASLLRERLAYAPPDHLPLVEADQAEPPELEHPQHWWLTCGWHPLVLPPGRVLSATPRAEHRQAAKPPVASPTMSTP
jgi:hypothetical protein